jgi:hypothetical protein
LDTLRFRGRYSTKRKSKEAAIARPGNHRIIISMAWCRTVLSVEGLVWVGALASVEGRPASQVHGRHCCHHCGIAVPPVILALYKLATCTRHGATPSGCSLPVTNSLSGRVKTKKIVLTQRSSVLSSRVVHIPYSSLCWDAMLGAAGKEANTTHPTGIYLPIVRMVVNRRSQLVMHAPPRTR